MTTTTNVTTDWGSALADLRDTVGGMTNWAIKDDSSGGATSLAHGDYFVLTTATGEDLRIYVSNSTDYGYGGVRCEYGPNWDTSTAAWSDRYSSDPRAKYDGGASGSGHQSQDTIAPIDAGSGKNQNSVAMSDTVKYWLAYADASGFTFYAQRAEADGYDGDVAVGFAEVAKAWNYDNAANREADYAVLFEGPRHHDGDYGPHYFGYTHYLHVHGLMCAGGTVNQNGYGMVNPDANYNNYPIKATVLRSSQYTAADGYAVIGTQDLHVDERSGSDTAHRDTIENSSGTTTHTILKYNTVAMAMKHI